MSSDDKPPKDWWVEFVNENPIPPESLEHFSRIEWTNRYLQDPKYGPIPAFSRTLKPNGEDHFFAETIKTSSTIPHYVCLKKKDLGITQASSAPQEQSSILGRKPAASAPEKPDCIFLLSSGPRGLDGHAGVMHGGVCCAILDETIGLMVLLHVHNIEGPVRKSHAYTIYLHTTFRAPVPTPAEIVVKTWITKTEGRKWTAMGQILDKNGTICTEAECLYVLVPSQKL